MADGLKDRNLQDYYESLLAMFSTTGWKYIAEDLEKLHAAANTLDGIVTQSDLDFRRGQIDILRFLATQPAVTAAAYDTLLAEDK